LILVQLTCLAWDLMAYRKKTDFRMKQGLAILGLGLAADLGSLLVAAGACAMLGLILGTLYYLAADQGSLLVATDAYAVLGFILGTLFSIYLATDQGSLHVAAGACAALGFILGTL
jgi:hypothetical protein